MRACVHSRWNQLCFRSHTQEKKKQEAWEKRQRPRLALNDFFCAVLCFGMNGGAIRSCLFLPTACNDSKHKRGCNHFSLSPSLPFFLPSTLFQIAAFILRVRGGNRGSENFSVEPKFLHPRGDFIRSSGTPPLCSFYNDERDLPLCQLWLQGEPPYLSFGSPRIYRAQIQAENGGNYPDNSGKRRGCVVSVLTSRSELLA